MRQFICSVLALAASVSVFLLTKATIGQEYASWLCIAAAAPLAVCGFFQYNGLTLERFVWTYLKSEWIVPRKRIYASTNFHYDLIFAPEKKQKSKPFSKKKNPTRSEFIG